MENELLARIQERLKALKISPSQASLRAGLSKDAIRNLQRGSTIGMRTQSLKALAPVLDTSVEWLLEGNTDSGDVDRKLTDGRDDASVSPPSKPRPALFDIPVYGLAAGSITGSQKLGDEPIQYVTRPPGLHTVKDAYAMMVTGTSMEPRYFAGEIIFLHPHRPPRTGDHVAIQEMVNGDTRTWIKRFEKLTEDHLITTQYNPAIEVKYSRKYIAAVHRVMTPNELMGI